MAAIYTGPAIAFDQTFHTLDDGRHAKIFTGRTNKEVLDQMDRTKAEVEAKGGQEVHRTSIGRNTLCPCGSKLKYKKCCLQKM